LQALEGGSYADDQDVRAMWTNLVCNAVTDPTKTHVFVIETLKRMNGADARALRRVAAATPLHRVRGGEQGGDVGPWDEPGLRHAVVRLDAFGLIEPVWNGYSDDEPAKDGRLRAWLNPFGRQFLDAVE
jgi:hypothetical protein